MKHALLKRNGWKKVLPTFLTLTLFLCLTVPALAADVRLSPQKLTVDGVEVACEKYNIDGDNYFKLRDLAYVLSGAGSAFAVDWDGERRTVSITTGQDYTEAGGELAVGADHAAEAQTSAQTIMIDGEVVEDLSVYNIGGNNFFRLRDLGAALGFAVDYDAESNTAVVSSAGSAAQGTAEDAERYLKLGAAAYDAEDYGKAVFWLGKAAQLGYAQAQNDLALCYDLGLGVAQDQKTAIALYLKAAEQGNIDGQYDLGFCYYKGYGVEQDYEAAVKWFTKAAEQEDVDSQYFLGLCYYDGTGVEQDYEAAVEWFRKAAEQNFADAQFNLGECYELGRGVPQDAEQAEYWYGLAAGQGVTKD